MYLKLKQFRQNGTYRIWKDILIEYKNLPVVKNKNGSSILKRFSILNE